MVQAYTAENAFIPGHYGRIRALAFSPDGSRFYSAGEDQLLLVGDSAGGQLVGYHNLAIGLVAVTAAGQDQVLLGTQDNRVLRFDLQAGKTILELVGHAGRLGAVAISPDGALALSGSDAGEVRLWRLQSGAELRRLDEDIWGYASVAISPDGQRVLAGLWSGQIILLDAHTGERLCMLTGHTAMIFGGIRFLPDGKRAVSAGGDVLSAAPSGALRMWDLQTCSQVAMLAGERRPPWDLDLSADGRFAVYGAQDGVHLWDLQTGAATHLLDLSPQNARSVAFSPDGRTLLVGPGKGLSQKPDYRVLLLDRDTGQVIRRFPGHTEAVTDLAFTPDGRRALSGSFDKELILWDISGGAELRRFSGHAAAVTALALNPDGRLAASGSLTGEILVWDLARGEAIRRLQGHTRTVYDLAFYPTGDTLRSAADDDTLREWRVDTSQPALMAWVRTNRYMAELTCEQWRLYGMDCGGNALGR